MIIEKYIMKWYQNPEGMAYFTLSGFKIRWGDFTIIISSLRDWKNNFLNLFLILTHLPCNEEVVWVNMNFNVLCY